MLSPFAPLEAPGIVLNIQFARLAWLLAVLRQNRQKLLKPSKYAC
jgi:hypothetical protein